MQARGGDDFLGTVGRSWEWVLVFGIASLVLGVLVAVDPRATISGLAILLGIWLFLSGLFRIVAAITDNKDSGSTRVLIALRGFLSVVVGALFLHHTNETVATLAFLIALIWIVGGIIEAFSAYTHRDTPGRRFRILVGLLGFVAGLVTLVVPSITLDTLAAIMGIWLAIYGGLQIATAIVLRKLTSARR
jgi:uncharacterized membrane protein HdeD (DUF308 family)